MHPSWLPPQRAPHGPTVLGQKAGSRHDARRLATLSRSLWHLIPLLVTTTLSAASEKELPRADATVRACLACHVLTGKSGDGPPALIMPESRFVAAMGAFRSGQRRGSVMNRIATGFTEEEIRDMARFLANSSTRAR